MSLETGPDQIGTRLRQARQARGLSLQAVADRLSRPVTRAALSKYERGQVVPRADVLIDLARVLGLPPSHFLEGARGQAVSVRWVAYRKHSRLGAREHARIQARAEILGEAYLRLIDRLEPGFRRAVPQRKPARTLEDAEKAAAELRDRWKLGAGPIDDLVARVEDAGVLVLGWREGGRFDALSGWIGEGWPLVVLNLERPADRCRFNLAHEIGHLVIDASSLEASDEERLAHRFAAALLVPAEAARRELGTRRQQLTRAELEHLKGKYGVSMQAWTRRARDLGIVSEQTYRDWQIWFRSQALHVRESVDYTAEESPSRLEMLFVRALAERLVDLEWVRALCPEAATKVESAEGQGPAALLRTSDETRRAILEQAAAEAAADYETDPEVEEFLGFDDEEPED
jgi:Zn-dependent peptidase ImmA (M78 family)/DNA-binding XRE family transcriptional regulator